MQLNDLSPGVGARHASKRVGRGIGSGLGKTSCRGHKGQKARCGGFHRIGFEGGQTPLHRRLPKFGFVSRQSIERGKFHEELSLLDLQKAVDEKKLSANVSVTLEVLKATKIIRQATSAVKILGVKIEHNGALKTALTLKGFGVTKSARLAIEAAGGKVEE